MSSYRITELRVQNTCISLPAMVGRAHLPIWDKSEVGRRIVILRAAKNMNQKTLADAIGIRNTKLWNYEHGRDALPHEHAAAICNVTGVDFDYLFRGMIDRLAPDLQDAIIEARKKTA